MKKYVTTWGNAVSIADRRPENYARDLTLRYPIRPMFDGDRLKITLDNFCGTQPVTISHVYVADSADSGRGIAAETSTPVTFDNGSRGVTIPAGEAAVSDGIRFPVRRGNDISVSFYLGDFVQMRSAVLITGPLSKGYYAVGDYAQSGMLPLDLTRNTNWFYFLSNVEIETESTNRAVICYGDSITSQAWPDYLTLRLFQEDIAHTAIVRRAASGTRILRQYDNITYDSYGLKGSVRFPREARVSGADTVIIQHGINDIIHPVGVEVNPFRPWSDLPTADDLIQGLREYVRQARAYGLAVYIGTLLPIYGWRTYEPFRDELRCAVNAWIRRTPEIDGCIDFDEALRDSARPAAFAQCYDSGDHLHPSESAYERMAAQIPEILLRHKEK
ncbi:MAG: lipase [Lachnospiraceae bacterium]|jgi:lysophospholipase L1-like esterase|nr:lipase [Lachnospiraceae bacterium]MCI8966797.1 lipase [Lachnospiraceae bacterium]